MYATLLLWIESHGVYGLSVFMAAESFGLPLPTEMGFIVGQSMVGAKLCTLWQLFLWIVAGHLTGAGISYYLGRAGDSALNRYLSHRPGVVVTHERMQRWYAKYGVVAVLIGRLIGQVRPWSSFAAGLSRVPPFTFWLWTVIGTILFTTIAMWVTAIGYRYWQANREVGVPIVVGMLLVFYGVPIYKGLEHLMKHLRKRRTASKTDETP